MIPWTKTQHFLNYPEDVDHFPLNFFDIAAAQLLDPVMQTYEAQPKIELVKNG
jgi:hypothetical protein